MTFKINDLPEEVEDTLKQREIVKVMTKAYRQGVVDTYKIVSDVFESTIAFYDKKLRELGVHHED